MLKIDNIHDEDMIQGSMLVVGLHIFNKFFP